jgi:hypothetical protein
MIRARWTTEAFQVLLKYAQYCASGDAMVGRLLVLLNPQSSQFSVVAPHFQRSCDEAQQQKHIELCTMIFGAVSHQKLRNVLPYLTASLIYHWKFLKRTLPDTHPLWYSAFGRMTEADIESHLPEISIGTDDDESYRVKGVPASVWILTECRGLKAALDEHNKNCNEMKDDVRKLAELIPMSAAGISLCAQQTQFAQFSEALSTKLKNDLLEVLRAENPRKRPRTWEESDETSGESGGMRVDSCDGCPV